MKKNWIIITLFFLLAVNAAFLATLIIQKSRISSQIEFNAQNNERPMFKNRWNNYHKLRFEDQLILELGMDKEQAQQLKDLSVEFHSNKKLLNQRMFELKREYTHAVLIGEADELYLDELADSLGHLLTKKILLDFKHCENIKSICRPEQAQKLDSLGRIHMHRFEHMGHRRRQGAPLE